MRSPRPLPSVTLMLAASAALILLHACQDAPQPTELDPTVSAAVARALTVTGGGTGDGVVTSTPARIKCTITAGKAGATGCKTTFGNGSAVTLVAAPKAGHAFRGWFGSCTGTGNCKLSMTAARAVGARFAPSQPTGRPAVQGRWGAAFPTPVVAVHMNLLPTAKVLLWGDHGDAQLWDPANPGAGFTAVSKTYRIFCSGHTFLADGRLLVTGGVVTGTMGDARTVLFDPISGAWSDAGPMAQGRYYPTTTALPNGEILAVSGNDGNGSVVTIPEIWNGSAWRQLTTASLAIPAPFYPAMFVAPSGKVFLAGFPQTSRYLDVTGTGAWTTVGDRTVADRRMGTAVMYAVGKILYVGGGDPPTSSAEAIDLNAAAPAWRPIHSMQFARRQANATLLADGQVLVTNGTSGPGFNDVTKPVFDAELWNPATQSWTTMARESVVRTYHSTALLLPDGRVLSSGSGEGGGVTLANSQLSAQIFSPPYLFNADGTLAPRPVISSAPATIGYGQTLTVETPDAGSVTRGTLIRLSSVTHAFNQSQRIMRLNFSATGPTTLSATGPASANAVPPGPYMLFLLSASGVPSLARMITVGP